MFVTNGVWPVRVSMSDRVFYPVVAAFAALMILLALAWPQGLGAVSPGVFAQPVQIPDVVRMERDKAARQKTHAADQVRRQAEMEAAEAQADKELSNAVEVRAVPALPSKAVEAKSLETKTAPRAGQ